MKKENEKEMFDVDAQLDAFFGKEGTPERRAAQERANAFFKNYGQTPLCAIIGTFPVDIIK